MALPVTNDPNSPRNGAINIQTDDMYFEMNCAMYTGMLGRSLILIAELVNTCTIINVTPSAMAVDFIENTTSFAVGKKFFIDLVWIINPATTAIVSNVPGEYRNSQSEFIFEKPIIPFQDRFTFVVKNVFSGAETLDASSNRITTMYGDQAFSNDMDCLPVLISLVDVVHGCSITAFGNKNFSFIVKIATIIVQNGVKIDTNS